MSPRRRVREWSSPPQSRGPARLDRRSQRRRLDAWVIGDEIEDLTGQQRRKPLLGSGSALAMPFEWARRGGAALLLATDGLHRYAPRPSIVSAIRGGASAAAIVDLARLPPGALHDDVAVVLYRFAAAVLAAGR